MRLMLALLVVAASHTPATAYPEFQLSTGTARCSGCHFSPVGGGLVNDYGRDEAASISEAGDGRFLHGLAELPPWIALGGDLRVAGFGSRVRSGVEAAVFPMQVDLYARAATGNWSVQAAFGALSTVRSASFWERVGSREHYVMYEPASKSWYARAGRFFPAFGLRVPDHTAYVRRYTGLHSFEESYGVGAGVIGDRSELHVTLTTPLELHPRVGRSGWGAAVQLERLDASETSGWSIHAKVAHRDGEVDAWLGTSWKRWIEATDLWLAAELDAGAIVGDGPSVGRLAAYGAVHYRPGKPWGAAFGVHAFDADLRLPDNDRFALEPRFVWFPRAHFEIAALVRWSLIARELARGDAVGFLQLHYFL